MTQGSGLRLLCLGHWQAGSLPLVPLGIQQIIYTSDKVHDYKGNIKTIIHTKFTNYSTIELQSNYKNFAPREFGGECIHVYVWLSPFAIHLKLSQIVKLLYSNTKKHLKKEKFRSQTSYFWKLRKDILQKSTGQRIS